MWLLIAREPRPDASDWYGRRWLAVADAVGWPMLLAWGLEHVQEQASVGIAGPTFLAVLVLVTFRRLYRALWTNHRYFFTTWRWGKVLAALLVMGWVMKLSMGV